MSFCARIFTTAFGTAVVSLTNSRCIVFCNSRSAVIVKEVVVVVVLEEEEEVEEVVVVVVVTRSDSNL